MAAFLFAYWNGLNFQNIWAQNAYLSVSTFGFIFGCSAVFLSCDFYPAGVVCHRVE
jgi:hypothetical protein